MPCYARPLCPFACMPAVCSYFVRRILAPRDAQRRARCLIVRSERSRRSVPQSKSAERAACRRQQRVMRKEYARRKSETRVYVEGRNERRAQRGVGRPVR